MSEEHPQNGGHNEAKAIAFANFMDRDGQNWAITLRYGIAAQEAVAFAEVCADFTRQAIEKGWAPIGRNQPVEYPRKAVKDHIAEEAQKLAQGLAKEIAAQAEHDHAAADLVRYAIKAGLMANTEDDQGKAAVVALGKQHGLDVKHFARDLGDWLYLLAQHRAAQAQPAQPAQPAKPTKPAQPAQPAQGAQPARQGRGGRKYDIPPADIAQLVPAGGKATYATQIKIVANDDGSPKIQFGKPTLRWPLYTENRGPGALLDASDDLADLFSLAELEEIGRVHQCKCWIITEPSENLNSRGEPYQDLLDVIVEE